MTPEERIQHVAQALAGRGFRHAYARSGYCFRGTVQIAGAATQVEVRLRDMNFTSLPTIRLVERPAGAHPYTPHLGADGGICYAVSDIVTPDVFDPGGQVLGYLDRAVEVIEQAMAGHFDEDLEREFFVFWGAESVLVDIDPIAVRRAHALLAKRTDGRHYTVVLTEDATRSRKKLEMASYEFFSRPDRLLTFTTSRQPRMLKDNWPPATVGQFLAWQRGLDKHCARRIQDALLKDMRLRIKARRLRPVRPADAELPEVVFVMIHSPSAWYAGAIIFPKAMDRSRRRLVDGLNLLPTLLGSVFYPMRVQRIDDAYLATRNTPGAGSLLGKRIALIGCGTIGGYLADLLMRAGAGLGDGHLALIDSGMFEPGNVGRHRLGFRSIYAYKSTALREDLLRAIPSANITNHVANAASLPGLGAFDLVIDATGEEALSNHLNDQILERPFVSTVFCWIAGEGQSVHALLRDCVETGCYCCVTRPRGVAGDGRGPEFAGEGCEGLYVPFPASVSVSAAALAMEAVSAWANGTPSPRYRVRAISPEIESFAYDPLRRKECPSCGR